MADTSSLTPTPLVKTPAMIEVVAKQLALIYGPNPPDNVWPSSIPQANIILDAIIAEQLIES